MACGQKAQSPIQGVKGLRALQALSPQGQPNQQKIRMLHQGALLQSAPDRKAHCPFEGQSARGDRVDRGKSKGHANIGAAGRADL